LNYGEEISSKASNEALEFIKGSTPLNTKRNGCNFENIKSNSTTINERIVKF